MKKILLFLLIVLLGYLLLSLYFLNKDYFLCPIGYKRDLIIRNDSRGYGFFSASRSNGARLHRGIDLLADIGTAVMASRSGKVISAKQSKGMGNYVMIQHSGNLVTVYGHLYQIYVNDNEFVRQGQIIGSVGKTGNANHRDIQAHLHFEIRKNDVPQDPLEYLP
jgi:murein DD-endopeptidase MepM/ murein hydrolase activator NlpD